MKAANLLAASVCLLAAPAVSQDQPNPFVEELQKRLLAAQEKPQFGEPLKPEYISLDEITGASRLFDTGKTATGVSLTCRIGKAIPDPAREDWYTNVPIPGLILEALPVLVNESEVEDDWDRSYGFIRLVKNGSVLVQFKPIGADPFSAWNNEGTDYRLYSGLVGKDGFATFDLLDGNGFYYRTQQSEEPGYFLSNCTRTEVGGLPVYDYEFPGLESSDNARDGG